MKRKTRTEQDNTVDVIHKPGVYTDGYVVSINTKRRLKLCFDGNRGANGWSYYRYTNEHAYAEGFSARWTQALQHYLDNHTDELL